MLNMYKPCVGDAMKPARLLIMDEIQVGSGRTGKLVCL